MITGVLALDWALLSLSLFNVVVLLWLGLTMYLTADRRNWGAWLAQAGLMLGAGFFVSHTAMLGRGMATTVGWGLNVWWRLGWSALMLTPVVWYGTVLWYCGFGDGPATRLHRRHRVWLALTGLFSVTLLLGVWLGNILPTYTQVVSGDLSSPTAVGGISLLFLLFPALAVVCTLLPLDAVLSPEPSLRMMGDVARGRARSWLIATSLVFVGVTLAVAAFFFVALGRFVMGHGRYTSSLRLIAGADLILNACVAGAVVLLGQAIVSYEIFTGRTLPRRGFARLWRSAVLVAAGYAALMGWTVVAELRSIYAILLATVLLIGFFALFGWRTFAEREQFVTRLRPFVSSQQLVQHVLQAPNGQSSRAATLFVAVCQEVLGASQAHLVPLGALAPLVGAPLSWPPGTVPPATLETVLASLPTAAIVSLDPSTSAGLPWAIPLWTDRGLVGALLLGPKMDRGLYSQEEIEVARASAERIVDTLAAEELARRLMELQRRRLAETRVLDLRTRRVLHDDVLPALHATILTLGAASATAGPGNGAVEALMDIHRQIADLIHDGGSASPGPSSDWAGTLRALVLEEYAGAFQGMTWHGDERPPTLDPLVQEVVIGATREVVRNAALHGRGANPGRPLHLSITLRWQSRLQVIVRDDGVGLRPNQPAVIGGRGSDGLVVGAGSGLKLHSTLLALVGGDLTLSSLPEGGTQVIISAPLP